MRRRLFLKSAPTIGIAAVAGCPAVSDDSPQSATSDDSRTSPTPPETTTQEPRTQGPGEAAFELRNLSHPSSLERGDQIQITVDIVNTGGKTGETTIEMAVGDVACSTTTTIEAGGRETVTCSEQLSISEGTYEVTVTESETSESIVGELTVEPLIYDLSWSQLPGPPGGPVKDIAVSPADDNYLYAMTGTAGLYASTDGGESWIQGPESEHHGRLMVASPHDPEEARTTNQRTVDGGNTWFIGAHKPQRRRLPDTSDMSVGDIAFDPFDESILYAGMTEGLYRTTDGGRSWEAVDIDADTETRNVSWVDTAAGADGVVYAAYYADATVVRSEDHGDSWEVVVASDELPAGRMRGLVAERSGDAAYVCVDNQGVYRVGDGEPQPLGPEVDKPRGPYFLFYDGPTLSADDERLYFHAFSLEKDEDADDMWDEMDLYEYDGSTGEMRTIERPEEPASVTAHPSDPETLYFGGWSWVWESTDRAKTWTALSNEFTDRYLSTVGSNPDRPGTLVPGSICSGGIWTSHDHGQTYEWKRSGVEPFMSGEARHYEEHYIMRAAAAGDRFYVTSAAGLLISEDNGDTWRLETGVPGYETHGIDHYHGLAVDPNDPMRVFMGNGLGRQGRTNRNRRRQPETDRPSRIWRSSDGGESWQEVTNGFPSDRRTVVQDILVSNADGDVGYVGTNANDYIAVGRDEDGGTGFGVFRSTNAGGQWEKLSTPFSNVHSLTQDADDPETILASTPQGVFRSENKGESWQQVLPDRTKALLSHPEESGVVFAGAQKYENYWDLLVSTDGGDTWGEGNLTIQVGTEPDAREYDGIDHNAHYRGNKGQIMDFAFDASESHLVAATRGASIWQGTVEALD